MVKIRRIINMVKFLLEVGVNKVTVSKSLISFALVVLLTACSPSLSLAKLPAVINAPATTVLVSAPAAAPAASPKTQTGDLFPQEAAFVQLYEQVNPSVVNIRVVLSPQSVNQQNVPSGRNQQSPQVPQIPQDITPQAVASGFIFDNAGHIVTNNHVIDGAQKIVVTFSDGTEAAATLVGADPASDLAVIQVKVDASMIKPVVMGDSDALKVGQMVVTIGNPFGLEGSMSTGIVSGLGRLLPTDINAQTGQHYSIPDIVQTDAPINPGNSGGPLLDLHGEVVGVNTAIESNAGTSSGVGYAVPAAIVNQVIPQLIANGKVQHPWLGISGGALNADLATAMNLEANQRGVLIGTIVANGPASKAGLRASTKDVTIDGLPIQVGGDVIVGINEQTVKTFDDLLTYVLRHTNVGDQVTLHILRDGKPMDVPLSMAARPS
jgi:S1-C subfamily serine protease